MLNYRYYDYKKILELVQDQTWSTLCIYFVRYALSKVEEASNVRTCRCWCFILSFAYSWIIYVIIGNFYSNEIYIYETWNPAYKKQEFNSYEINLSSKYCIHSWSITVNWDAIHSDFQENWWPSLSEGIKSFRKKKKKV